MQNHFAVEEKNKKIKKNKRLRNISVFGLASINPDKPNAINPRVFEPPLRVDVLLTQFTSILNRHGRRIGYIERRSQFSGMCG